MATKKKRKVFDGILAKIANVLQDATASLMGDQSWKYAFAETLYPPTGAWTGGLQKFRVVLFDGSLASEDISTPKEAKHLINEAWDIQAGLFPQTWYGLKIKVYPDGKYETEFDFDPDCLEKKTLAFLGLEPPTDSSTSENSGLVS
jgi:hypothetical protein